MEYINTTSFGQNLQKYRKLCGFTQQELAEKSEYSLSYIHDLEQGKKEPSFEALKKLATVLEISLDQLSYDADDIKDTDDYFLKEALMLRSKMTDKQKKLADRLGLKLLEEIMNCPDG